MTIFMADGSRLVKLGTWFHLSKKENIYLFLKIITWLPASSQKWFVHKEQSVCYLIYEFFWNSSPGTHVNVYINFVFTILSIFLYVFLM